MTLRLRLLSLLTLFAALHTQAQTDTLQLSLPEAEKTFLQKNLSLLAAHYNVDAQQALIRQARLWDNPVLLTDQNLYDGRFFRHEKGSAPNLPSGQVYLQVQQLIRTGGKIRKLTEIAGTNTQISQLQFDELMHNLRYTLHTDLYRADQLQRTLQLFNEELTQANKLLRGMEAQLKAGNISQKDFLRIQALQLSIAQENSDYQKQLADVQTDLQQLLQVTGNTFIQPEIKEHPAPSTLPALDNLLLIAKQNNPEYRLQQANYLAQQQNLRYQQALRAPDVTVGIEYDKANSYVPNYYGLTIALPLPLINRNQGNIASAAYNVKQQQTLVSQQEQKLQTDLQNALRRLTIARELQQETDSSFLRKYNQLLQNAITAYQQRQLGLLEFTDLFSAYKDTELRYLQLQYNLFVAIEDVNLLAGKDVL